MKVCVFDDSPKIRSALEMIISHTEGIEWGGAYRNYDNLLEVYKSEKPQVVIMDIQMPGKNGIEAVKELKKFDPQSKILMLTNFDDDEKVFSTICFGASGYILKNTPQEDIIQAVFDVAAGGSPLTPLIASKVLNIFRSQNTGNSVTPEYNLSNREKDVLQCLIKGLSLKMVGDTLHISYDTVRTHIKHIYEKLHVFSMTEAVAKAINEKLV